MFGFIAILRKWRARVCFLFLLFVFRRLWVSGVDPPSRFVANYTHCLGAETRSTHWMSPCIDMGMNDEPVAIQFDRSPMAEHGLVKKVTLAMPVLEVPELRDDVRALARRAWEGG